MDCAKPRKMSTASATWVPDFGRPFPASDHGLSPTWLNANAASFIPATFDPGECEVFLAHPRLLVLEAPLRDVFVMKIYRGSSNDLDGMVAKWPRT